ncbi:MAG: hypothetical protein ACI93R_001363 [Flavobacteriales bacterium]|jgi:hypothetical protein
MNTKFLADRLCSTSLFGGLRLRKGVQVIGLIIASIIVCSQSYAYSDLELIAETTDCNGEGGFSTFNARDIVKVKSGDCFDPNTPGKKLQQILIKSELFPGSFDIIWVSQSEARSVMQQIKAGRAAKLKHLEGPEIRVDVRQHSSVQPAPPASATTVYAAQNTRGESQPNPQSFSAPTIAMIDPPVVSTRSAAKILTASNIQSRSIVGKIEAPAGIMSLTVNGAATQVDSNGLFKADIPLETHETPVSVIVVDKQGKIQKLDFMLSKAIAKKNNNTTDDTQYGDYYALIIANTDYQHLDKLVTPANDAKVLSSILENKYGFQVTQVNNTSRYDLMTALNDMRSKLNENDNLLIYYAGHGAFDKTNNRGHWLPVDAEPESTANWVSTTAITDIVNAMSAKHILLIADSCYSGALTRSTDINITGGMSEDLRQKWLQSMAKNRSRHLLTSGGIKPVIDDGGNGHSIFANALIEVLQANSGIVEGSQIYTQVKKKVEIRAQELNVEQSPLFAKLQDSEHEFGEFLLLDQ